jgi:hypothetical protein
MVLTLPELAVSDQCRYSELQTGRAIVLGQVPAPPKYQGERDCDALLSHTPGVPASLREYLDGFEDAYGPPPKHVSRKPGCTLSNPTHNGKFEPESCYISHRNFWGNPVVTDASETILSVGTGEAVGTVKLSTRHSVRTRFAYQNNIDYLLVVESGTELKVYKIAP